MLKGSNALIRSRRLAAQGERIATAVAETSPEYLASGMRLSAWEELSAAQLGMPVSVMKLLLKKGVTDVLINETTTWLDRGAGLERTSLDLGNADEVRSLAVRMAAAAGRRLDDASPVVDAVLGDRFRLHAVLPPVSRQGVAISLRVVRTEPFSVKDLVEGGSLDLDTAEILLNAVKQANSLLICGGTGAGKTTLLATLLSEVPHDKRIVCIEEVSELTIDHPHVVRLQSRAANVEGKGEVSLDDLVRAAVRMRPDRLVLGECRGSEVREVLTAMNTGHSGSCATIHANSIEDVPARLFALGALGGMDQQAVSALAGRAFDLLVFLSRDQVGIRRVVALGELRSTDGVLQGIEIHRSRAAQGDQFGPAKSCLSASSDPRRGP
ncbi:TadA family conjugal transfer-associated ATPase [Actinomycetaceae bacterium MB13-C1-2]|nr:TadA family conjugal transfer-associated ATPase [Actinomycetaceae bacterium MB13-C1-2]